jgi:hypothetical protein
MESRDEKRRFPPPWPVERTQHGYVVKDANGVVLASIYCRDDLHAAQFDDYRKHLTSDEARRIAKAIARIPDFLQVHPEFVERRVKRIGRWRASHPYHVALQNSYVQENYDAIAACCRYNNVPFDATGEKIERGYIRWCVYEFERQFDAIRFWDKFEGRWIESDEFIFPARPVDLPRMKSLRYKGSI